MKFYRETSKGKEEEGGWRRAAWVHKAKDNDLRTDTYMESGPDGWGSCQGGRLCGEVAVELSIQRERGKV